MHRFTASSALLALFGLFAVAHVQASGLPTLPEAFGRGIPGAGAVAPGTDLFRVDVPGDRYPDAHCADGSPAVFYVRRARDAAHRDDWVVYLQGGGSCHSGEQCHARWLGRDGNFGANKLSSRFAPARGIAGGGIEDAGARNPFARWNHVFVYYCSSDGWAGTAKDVETEAVHEGVVKRYRIDLLGARIVDAVFDLLRSGQLAYAGANGERVALPDLDGARRVLFAGSSAGGSGVRTNADRIGALLRAQSSRCDGNGCGPTYAAVIDTSYSLSHEGLDHGGSLACGPEDTASCTYEKQVRSQWFGSLLGFRRGITDESCVDYHAPRGDEWRCADGVHLLQHHVMTPFFVRVDLQDPLVMDNTLDARLRYQGMPVDAAVYGALTEIQLLELATLASRSEEPRPVSALEPPGVFGPQCGDHETLRTDAPTYGRAVVDEAGVPRTMLELLDNWLAGRRPAAVVEHF
ncbi:MAG TPA: pectin acetylesterase-family hydrolase, partial [Candidatus Saccharimonadia bacterium]|nr:pectin acetylesterase-family hydrolase [Candidatus Saccharimonadia bacterium]